jgi:hypothetical protein
MVIAVLVLAHGGGCWECGLGTSVVLLSLVAVPVALIWCLARSPRPDGHVRAEEGASPVRMIRIRRVSTHVPFSQLYEIELSSRGVGGTILDSWVTRGPAGDLTPHVGVGSAWALVREVNRQWELGERGWAVEFEYDPQASKS